ncbi:MAG: hypothetical protein ABSF24_02445 [Candidatus Bathyarchaeia archaeon]|jgi:hypothetical protein
MKKSKLEHEPLEQGYGKGAEERKIVPSSVLRRKKQKVEKLWLIQYFEVRRHSRTLYLPLDPTTVRIHDIERGDIVKAVLLALRKAPRPDEPIKDPGEL